MSKHVVKGLKLREISSVDRPAQVGAVSVLLKRADDPPTELAKASFQEALTGALLADRVRDTFYKAFENTWQGQEAFRKALVDELAADGDGSKAKAAYVKWFGGLVDKAVAKAKDIGAADSAALEKAFTEAAEEWLADQETGMTIKTKAALGTAIEKALAAGAALTVADVSAIHTAATELGADDMLPADGPLAKAKAPAADPTLAARLDRMEKRDALAADLRKHYDTLTTDADRDAFLAKSADEQQAELNKGLGDDPVVYTTVDGTEIRKSAGDTVLALAKRNDHLARELAKSNATSEDVVLTKRAADELGNIGGDVVGKKALLKAVDGITDETTRELAKAVLTSANEVGKGAFIRKGSGEGGVTLVVDNDGPEMTESEAKLDELAKAHAAANPGTTYEQAYATVIQTAEGAELYKRYTAEAAAA